MNAEKKLNDEAAEKVTGGSAYDTSTVEFYCTFVRKNCVTCAKKNGNGCPYNSDLEKIYARYGKSTEKCSEHVPIQ